MAHSITAKLNNPAREHVNANGVTFFVSLGEKNYNFQTKQNEWTNYDAALFAKDAQIQFYRDNLVKDAVIEVSGTGILLDVSDPQYKPKLVIQDAKLGFINSPQGQQTGFQQPQQPQQQAPQGYQAPAHQPQQPQYQQPQNHAHLYNQPAQQQAAQPQQGGYQNQQGKQ